jgi:hypothetical protein
VGFEVSVPAAMTLGALAGLLVGVTLLADLRQAQQPAAEPTIEHRALAACLSGGGFYAGDLMIVCVPAGDRRYQR